MYSTCKSITKLILNKWKYRGKHVNLGWSTQIGYNTTFEGYNWVHRGSIFEGHLGYASYIGNDSCIFGYIGKYSCISDKVNVIQGKHPTRRFVSQHPAFYSMQKQCGKTYVDHQKFEEFSFFDTENRYSVSIGNDVWIGYGVTILEGISIGDGAIIAANSTVTSDVKPYCIVGGTPAKLIRMRFEPEEVVFLCNFKWWDKPNKWIEENANFFDDIEKFMENE